MENTNKIVFTLPVSFVQNISKEVVCKDLEPLINDVYAALEDAPRLAKEKFFEPQELKIDPFLINDIIRFYVKRYLTKLQFDVTEDYEVDDLANNGLKVRYHGYHVRILKADNGQLPVPGISENKKAFYNQQLTLDSLDFNKSNDDHLRPNILLLWELTDDYDFKQMLVACPKSGGKTRQSVTSYFNEPIGILTFSKNTQFASDESEEIEIFRIVNPSAEKTKINNKDIEEDIGNDIREQD